MSGVATRLMRIRDALADNGCLSTAELVRITGLSRRAVTQAVGRLILRGLAERVEIGCYQLTEDGMASARAGEALYSGPAHHHTGIKALSRNTFRQRAWAAMRMERKFTVPDIVRLAASGERHAESNLQRYLRSLEQHGYVRRLPVRERGTRPGSNGYRLWMLVRDTGPLAPVVRRNGAVIDRNTGDIIEPGGGGHERAA